MPLNKMGNFTFKHIDQQDDLYKTKTAAEIKAALDSQPNELKAVLNSLIDSLQATTAGDSGAKNLGVSTISGVTGANIQAVLEDLKLQINGAVAGSIPDGTITQAKLAFEIATDAASTTIADTGAHFTSTNVEGALDELFTSANSVKTNVSGAIGSPATVNDTGAQLASKITTEKGRIASEVGDGTSADSLQYLADRLIVRSDAIATAVNAKGVVATSADTLAQLGTKIGQIPTAGKVYLPSPPNAGSALFTNMDKSDYMQSDSGSYYVFSAVSPDVIRKEYSKNGSLLSTIQVTFPYANLRGRVFIKERKIIVTNGSNIVVYDKNLNLLNSFVSSSLALNAGITVIDINSNGWSAEVLGNSAMRVFDNVGNLITSYPSSSFANNIAPVFINNDLILACAGSTGIWQLCSAHAVDKSNNIVISTSFGNVFKKYIDDVSLNTV